MTDRTPTPTTDEGLRCPTCEYNLTGLADDVCPECGGTFDRGQLFEVLAGAPQPIPIWSTRGEIGALKAFGCTLLEIWIHPVRYAQRFPKNPQGRDPVVFSRWCLLIAIAMCLIPAMVVNTFVLQSIVHAAASLLIGVSLTERLIAGTVFIPITQLSWEENWYQRGLALTRMTRAFLVLSSICTSLAYLADLWSDNPFVSNEYGLWAMAITYGYWYFAILGIATTYRRTAMTFFVALLAVPVVTLASTSAGTFCALLIGDILF